MEKITIIKINPKKYEIYLGNVKNTIGYSYSNPKRILEDLNYFIHRDMKKMKKGDEYAILTSISPNSRRLLLFNKKKGGKTMIDEKKLKKAFKKVKEEIDDLQTQISELNKKFDIELANEVKTIKELMQKLLEKK